MMSSGRQMEVTIVMFQYHPALVKALQQDRYYRLVNERRRCDTNDRPARLPLTTSAHTATAR